MRWGKSLNLLIWALLLDIANAQLSQCRCTLVNTAEHWGTIDRQQCAVATIDGQQYCYPRDYGFSGCGAYDIGLAPECDGSAADAPAWCTQKWCYVDLARCPTAAYHNDVLPTWAFAGHEFYYSYLACSDFTYSDDQLPVFSNKPVPPVWNNRAQFLARFTAHLQFFLAALENTSSTTANCDLDAEFFGEDEDMCPCPTCLQSLWPPMMQNYLGLYVNPPTLEYNKYSVSVFRDDLAPLANCDKAASGLAMIRIAQSEYETLDRNVHMWYYDEPTASAIIWPACSLPDGGPDGLASVGLRLMGGLSAAASPGRLDIVVAVEATSTMKNNPALWRQVKDGLNVFMTGLAGAEVSGHRFGILAYGGEVVSRGGREQLYPMGPEYLQNFSNWLETVQPFGMPNMGNVLDTTMRVWRHSYNDGPECHKVVILISASPDPGIRASAREITAALREQDIEVFPIAVGLNEETDHLRFLRYLACQTSAAVQTLDTISDRAMLAGAMNKALTFDVAKARGEQTIMVEEENSQLACSFTYRSGSFMRRGVFCIDVAIASLYDDASKEIISPLFETPDDVSNICFNKSRTPAELDAARRGMETATCQDFNFFNVPRRRYEPSLGVAARADRGNLCHGDFPLDDAKRRCDLVADNCNVLVSNDGVLWQYCLGTGGLIELFAAYGLGDSGGAQTLVVSDPNFDQERAFWMELVESTQYNQSQEIGSCLRRDQDLLFWFDAPTDPEIYEALHRVKIGFPGDLTLRVLSEASSILLRDVYSVPVEELELDPDVCANLEQEADIETVSQRCRLLNETSANQLGNIYWSINDTLDIAPSLATSIDRLSKYYLAEETIIDPLLPDIGSLFIAGLTKMRGEFRLYATDIAIDSTIGIPQPFWDTFTDLDYLIQFNFPEIGQSGISISREERIHNCNLGRQSYTIEGYDGRAVCNSEGYFVPPQCDQVACRELLHILPYYIPNVVENLVLTLQMPFVITYLGHSGYNEVLRKWRNLPPLLVVGFHFASGVYPGNPLDSAKHPMMAPIGTTECLRMTSAESCSFHFGTIQLAMSARTLQHYPATLQLLTATKGMSRAYFSSIQDLSQRLQWIANYTVKDHHAWRAALCLKLRVLARTEDNVVDNFFGTCTSPSSPASLPNRACTANVCDPPFEPYYGGGSINNITCVCAPGTYRDLDSCSPCPAGEFCPNGIDRQQCREPGTSTQPASQSADDCHCEIGFGYDEARTRCDPCPFGYFKEELASIPCISHCPTHSTTRQLGAYSKLFCACDQGYYLQQAGDDYVCELCPSGGLCPGDLQHVAMIELLSDFGNRSDLHAEQLFQAWSLHSLPVTRLGYFAVGDVLRADGVSDTYRYNPFFIKCFKQSACNEGSICRDGYTGFMCLECEKGYGAYGAGGLCKSCHGFLDPLLFVLLLALSIPMVVAIQRASQLSSRNNGILTLMLFKILFNHLDYYVFIVVDPRNQYLDERWASDSTLWIREILENWIHPFASGVMEGKRLISITMSQAAYCTFREFPDMLPLHFATSGLSEHATAEVQRLFASLVFPALWLIVMFAVCWPRFYMWYWRRRSQLQYHQKKRAYLDWLQQVAILGETPYLEAYNHLQQYNDHITAKYRYHIWTPLPQQHYAKPLERLCVEAFISKDTEKNGRLSRAIVEDIIHEHLHLMRIDDAMLEHHLMYLQSLSDEDARAHAAPDMVAILFETGQIEVDEEGEVTAASFVHWLMTSDLVPRHNHGRLAQKASFGGWTIFKNFMRDSVPLFFIILYLWYPSIIDTCLTFVMCREAEGPNNFKRKFPLVSPETRGCYDDKYWPAALMGGVGLVIYGMGVPLLGILVVYLNKGTAAGREYCAWFFNGYDSSFPARYWDSFMQFRKLILALFWELPLDESSRFFAVLTVLVFLVIFNEKVTPFLQQRDNVLNFLERQSLATSALSILSSNIGATVEMAPEVILGLQLLATAAHAWFLYRIMLELWEDFTLWCYFKYKPSAARSSKEEDPDLDGEEVDKNDPLILTREGDDEGSSISDLLEDNKKILLADARLWKTWENIKVQSDSFAHFVTFGKVTNVSRYMDHPWEKFKRAVAARRVAEVKALSFSLDDVRRRITIAGEKATLVTAGTALANQSFGMALGVTTGGMKMMGSTAGVLKSGARKFAGVMLNPTRSSKPGAQAEEEEDNDDEDDLEAAAAAAGAPSETNSHDPGEVIEMNKPAKVPENPEDNRMRQRRSSLTGRWIVQMMPRHSFMVALRSVMRRGTTEKLAHSGTQALRQRHQHHHHDLRRHTIDMRMMNEDVLEFAPPMQLLLRSFLIASKFKKLPCESLLYLLTQACESMYANQHLEAADMHKVSALGDELHEEFEGALPAPPTPRDCIKFQPSLMMLESLRGRVRLSAKNREKVLTVSELDVYLNSVQQEDLLLVVRDLQERLAVQRPFPVLDTAVGLGPDDMHPRPTGAPKRTFLPPAETPAQLHGIIEKFGKAQKRKYAADILGPEDDYPRQLQIAGRLVYLWHSRNLQLKAHGINFHSRLRPHDLVSQAWHRRFFQIELAQSPWNRTRSDLPQTVRQGAEANLHIALAGAWGDASEGITRDGLLKTYVLSKEAKSCLQRLSHPGSSVDVLKEVEAWQNRLKQRMPDMILSAVKVWTAFERHGSSLEKAVRLPPMSEEWRKKLSHDIVAECVGVLTDMDPRTEAMPILHALRGRIARQSWRMEWNSCAAGAEERQCGICGHSLHTTLHCNMCLGTHSKEGNAAALTLEETVAMEGWEASHVDWLVFVLGVARDHSTARSTVHGCSYLDQTELAVLAEWKDKAAGGHFNELLLVPAMLDKNMSIAEWILRHALARRAATEVHFRKVSTTYETMSKATKFEVNAETLPVCWFADLLDFVEHDPSFQETQTQTAGSHDGNQNSGGGNNTSDQLLVDERELWRVLERMVPSLEIDEFEEFDDTGQQQHADEYWRSIYHCWEHILKGVATAQKVRLPVDHFLTKNDETCCGVVDALLDTVRSNAQVQGALKRIKKPYRLVLLACLVKQISESCRRISDWAYATAMRREQNMIAQALVRRFSARQDWGSNDRMDGLVLRTPRLAVSYEYELEDARIHKHRVYNSLWEFRLSTHMINRDDKEVNREWRFLERAWTVGGTGGHRHHHRDEHAHLRLTTHAEKKLQQKCTEQLRKLWHILDAEQNFIKNKAAAESMNTYVLRELGPAIHNAISTLPAETRSEVEMKLKDLPVMVATGIMMRLERRAAWERQFETRDGQVVFRDQSSWILNQIAKEKDWVRVVATTAQPRKAMATAGSRTPTKNNVFAGDSRTKGYVGFYTALEGEPAPIHMWNHIWKVTGNSHCQTDPPHQRGQSIGVEASLKSDVDNFKEVAGFADNVFELGRIKQLLELAENKHKKAEAKKLNLESVLEIFLAHRLDVDASSRRAWQRWLQGVLHKLDEDAQLDNSSGGLLQLKA